MSGRDKIQGASARRWARRAGGVSLAACLALASISAWAAPASAASLPTVTIGRPVDIIPFTPVDMALAKGYFQKNGVNVKEVLVHGSSTASAAMVGGSMQFTCLAAGPLMLARSHGVPIVSVDAFNDTITLQVIVSDKWLAKHPIPANATFKQKMADLNGSILAEVGTTEQTFFGLLRGWAGLPKLTGYRVEKITSMAATAVAMQRGIVDVAIESPPASVQTVQQGYAKLLIDRRDVPQFNNVTFDILTTTSSYARQHPKITTAVASSIAEAQNFMRSHPDETLALEQKHFPKLSKSVIEQSLELSPFEKDGLQSQKGWDSAVKLAQQTGLIHGITSAPEGVYWTNKYIDRSKLGQ